MMVTMLWTLKGSPKRWTSRCDQGRKAIEALQEKHRLLTKDRISVHQCVHKTQYFPRKRVMRNHEGIWTPKLDPGHRPANSGAVWL